ncbi:glycosyltransferase family 2 protein [Cohnella ginsengisoli]|uniref:Glycosyltransferase family 2 protein n=1 Tax=Cohnella ginsengisoli TaxID=425004 RepID=A0A9X4KM10_9BACL|nr:glycosyltransferase family 2 protein [Cohnella ginsengisoli]MDG0794578.1 glycosyltransferase family 2 protein [Cohnella ginsengisoli]
MSSVVGIKKDDLLACLESLLVADPNGDLFDIIVVDNASSDGAPEAVERMYGGQGQRIKLIQLAVNIGGSGGFNAGIVEALKAGYPYIHLLDNDVVVDPLAISELYERMEADRTLGMLGSKLYMHKEPERLQEYGSFVDWERFNVRPINKGVLDHEALPELLDCDYVPACSVMVRAEAIERCGLMDNLFFYLLG